MNLLRLKYFIALAEEKNITHTAAKLFIAQSNLSKQISLFEREIGVQLFERTRTGVELTSSGQLLYDKLKHVPGLIETSISHARDIENCFDFRIGTLEGFDFTRERFLALAAAYPNTQFSIERRSFERLRTGLRAGAYDAILTLGYDIEDCADFQYETIQRLTPVALISSDHPKASAESLAELSEESFVCLYPESSPRNYQMTLNVCREFGFRPQKFLYVETYEDLLLNVETHQTISVAATNSAVRRPAEIRSIPIACESRFEEVLAWDQSNRNSLLKELVRILKEY